MTRIFTIPRGFAALATVTLLAMAVAMSALISHISPAGAQQPPRLVPAGTVAPAVLGSSSIASHMCDGKFVTIFGTGGPDVIVGTIGEDVINGLGGDDWIYGSEGNDTICGGDGNDYIDGGANSDTIWGGDGNDTLWGGISIENDGNDHLYGGNGDDMMDAGGQPFDYCDGGAHIVRDTAFGCKTTVNVP